MEQEELQLGHYLRLLWKGKWLVLLTTLVAVGGMVAFSSAQAAPEPSYMAEATIKVEPVGVPAEVSSASPLSAPDRSLNTQILLLQSRNVMERALEKLQASQGEDAGSVTAFQVEELRRAVSVEAVPNSNLLELKVRGSTPEAAEARANAVIEAYVEYVKDERTRAVEEALQDINARISGSNGEGRLSDFLSVLLPEVSVELEQIIGSLEQGVGILEQLRSREDSVSPASSLESEAARLEQAAAGLGGIAQGLRSVQTRLEEGPQEGTSQGESPLALEASQVKRTVTDLELIADELRRTRSQVDQMQPRQVNNALATRAEEARDTLEAANEKLPAVQSLTVSQSEEMRSIKRYVGSIIGELEDKASQIREAPDGNLGLTEGERLSFQGQVLGYRSGLEAVSEDLEDIRQQTDVQAYGDILTAKGHIEVARSQLGALLTDLEEVAGASSIHDSISQVLTWTQESRSSLKIVSDNFLDLQVRPGTSEERQAAARASSGMDNASLTLEVAASRLQSLATGVNDPLLQGLLNAASGRLSTTQRTIAESSSRLKVVAQSDDVATAERVGSVRQLVQSSADSLRQAAEELRGDGEAPDSEAGYAEPAGRAYGDASRIAQSVNVASQQLQVLLESNSGPLLAGELGPLDQQLGSARQDVLSIADRLAAITAGDSAEGMVASELLLIQDRLKVAAESFTEATQAYDVKRDDDASARVGDAMGIKESIDVGTAILTRVAQELEEVQSSQMDPLRYGHLVVLADRIKGAQMRAEDVSSQLQDLDTSSNPEDREMRDLRRQLELSLLQPQETGITRVDSAVSRQPGDNGSFFSRMQVPLVGVAGLVLGSLAVLFKARLDPTVRSQSQLRDVLDLPTLGVVPKGKAPGNPHPPMVASGDQPAFSEALQLVGTGLAGHISKGATSFLVTSAGPREGKTMLAVNLAHVLAQYGYRVLLVDGNLRKPEVAEVLDLPNEEGLSTALSQQLSPMDYVVETEYFSVLPAGICTDSPVYLLSSPAMGFFLKQAQRSYDVVLVDGPPAPGFAEVNALGKVLDGSIVVVRAGVTRMDSARENKEGLQAAGIPVLATVLNFAPSEECGHLNHEKYRLKQAQ